MQERRVGTSGLTVSRLGLGTMMFGGIVDELEAEEQLTTFLGAGGTLIDTAPVYSDGRTEPLVGDLLSKLGARDDVVLAGKAAVGLRRGAVVLDASRGYMLSQLENSLRDLGTDHLDLWQVHGWDERTPWEETLSALEHAVVSGKTRYVGVSNFTGWQSAAARASATGTLGAAFVSQQVEYSLLQRAAEDDVVPAAQYLGLGVLAWSPLARGVLTGKYRDGIPTDSRGAVSGWERYLSAYLAPAATSIVDAVCRAADGLGVAPSDVALAWICDRPTVASALVGARTTAQLRTSLGAADLSLPPEIMEALDDVSAPYETSPYEKED